MDHYAAVKVHVAGGVGEHFAHKTILHAENIVGVGEIGEEVTITTFEGAIFVVVHFENTVLNSESVAVVRAEGFTGNFDGPAVEVFAVKEGDPSAFEGMVGGVEEAGTSKNDEAGKGNEKGGLHGKIRERDRRGMVEMPSGLSLSDR